MHACVVNIVSLKHSTYRFLPNLTAFMYVVKETNASDDGFGRSKVWGCSGIKYAVNNTLWAVTLQYSASRLVPRHCLNTFGRLAFAVAGPMSWNSLPNSLRASECDDNISDDCFKHSLKTFLFSGYWRIERSRGVYDSALYKCTFIYLLTRSEFRVCSFHVVAWPRPVVSSGKLVGSTKVPFFIVTGLARAVPSRSFLATG